MNLAIQADDVRVSDDDLQAASREVSARASIFAGVRDVRLRLRQAKGALLCVVAVGFAGGDLVTSTGTSDTPLDAIVGALDGLPERIDRVHRSEQTNATPSTHAAVRDQVKRLLREA